jgi:hypothetical protein
MAHRTEGAGYVLESGKRRFIDQNLPGTPGTVDPAESSNMFQEEICNVIELQGGTVAASAAADRAAGWRQLNDTIFENGNITESALNPETVSRLVGTTRPPHATPQDMCSGLLATQILNPVLPPNNKSTELTIIDSCCGWDEVNGKPKLIILDDSGDIYSVSGPWIYTACPEVDSPVLSLTYPSTPDHVAAICCDGDYLYVMWCLESGNWQVSKFGKTGGVYGGTPSWTADTGIVWADEGYVHGVCVIDADGSSLAAMGDAGGATTSHRKIAIISKSAGGVTSGTGSWASGYGDSFDFQNRKLVSDGTHVFWIQFQTAAENRTHFMMSAKISDPTTSDHTWYSIGTVVSADKYTHPRGLLCVNDNIIFSRPNGAVSMFSTSDEAIYYLFDFSGLSFLAVDYEGDQDVLLGFDGTNVLAHFVFTDPNNARQVNMLKKIPAGIISRMGASLPGEAVGIDVNSVVIETAEHEDTYTAGKLIFDMIDMWFITSAGYIFRIANPGVR